MAKRSAIAKRRRARITETDHVPRASTPALFGARGVLQALKTFRALVLRDAMRQTVRFLHGRNASLASIVALMVLQKQGSQSVSQLAREVGLSLAATSQLVDRLVRDKLVARRESPVDRRRKQLALTSADQLTH